jgi:isopentenyl phosphate kinase
MNSLVFLKLGGSVITDKDQSNTVNIERIDGIANEIIRALKDNAELSLLIGHGSGSFGHNAAKKNGTRDGVSTTQGWQGFAEVALRARELNQIVMERLVVAGVNAVSISPFSGIQTENHQVVTWDTSVLEQALHNHLIPVIYGDVVLDRQLGGTILSTEELFAWLALRLHPNRILLAGLEEGVWKDFPERTQMHSEIQPGDFLAADAGIKASESTDVTGGMRSKVEDMVKLVEQLPDLEIQIFSAVQPGNIFLTLMGTQKGTCIRNVKG